METMQSTLMARLYADVVAAMATLARGLDDETLQIHVPATPAWTVHDVLAHLAGGQADQVSGRIDGAPAPEWTSVHVSERSGLPVETLLDEVAENTPLLARRLAEGQPAGILWDATVHLTDLHEALGLGRPDEALWRPVLEDARPALIGDLDVDVDDYELFRAMFSRRSRAQMRAWGTGLDDTALDELPVFGPRDDDQPAPRP